MSQDQLTTERNALLQQQANTLQDLERIDEKLDRVVTVAEQRINALLTERDELRAQLAATYTTLLDVYETWAESGSVIEPMLRAKALLDKTPADAAQYVRGLEAALQKIHRRASSAKNNTDLADQHLDIIEGLAQQALAAKEDRG